jgi:hypothetical protein
MERAMKRSAFASVERNAGGGDAASSAPAPAPHILVHRTAFAPASRKLAQRRSGRPSETSLPAPAVDCVRPAKVHKAKGDEGSLPHDIQTKRSSAFGKEASALQGAIRCQPSGPVVGAFLPEQHGVEIRPDRSDPQQVQLLRAFRKEHREGLKRERVQRKQVAAQRKQEAEREKTGTGSCEQNSATNAAHQLPSSGEEECVAFPAGGKTYLSTVVGEELEQDVLVCLNFLVLFGVELLGIRLTSAEIPGLIEDLRKDGISPQEESLFFRLLSAALHSQSPPLSACRTSLGIPANDAPSTPSGANGPGLLKRLHQGHSEHHKGGSHRLGALLTPLTWPPLLAALVQEPLGAAHSPPAPDDADSREAQAAAAPPAALDGHVAGWRWQAALVRALEEDRLDRLPHAAKIKALRFCCDEVTPRARGCVPERHMRVRVTCQRYLTEITWLDDAAVQKSEAPGGCVCWSGICEHV